MLLTLHVESERTEQIRTAERRDGKAQVIDEQRLTCEFTLRDYDDGGAAASPIWLLLRRERCDPLSD